jgi:hypothetical protein
VKKERLKFRRGDVVVTAQLEVGGYEMSNRLLIAMIAIGVSLAGILSTSVAQEPPKQHHLTTEATEKQLKDAIARMTNLNPKEIEIYTTRSMLRVRLVNTIYNNDPASDREYLASTISALFTKTAGSEPSLQRFLVLHVEFVKREHWLTKTVDTVEFRKEADGTFAKHRT